MEIKPHANRPVLNPCTLEGRNYQVDPYIGCGHYCYYCYVLNQAETDWTKEVWYHENLADRLEEAISGIQPQSIYMGWHTDPYQPCEKECCQTRQALELLQSKGFSAGVLTKSDLILRDMDLLQKMDQASVSVSVAFKDNAVRQLFEADTMDTEPRIEALRKFKAAGVCALKNNSISRRLISEASFFFGQNKNHRRFNPTPIISLDYRTDKKLITRSCRSLRLNYKEQRYTAKNAAGYCGSHKSEQDRHG